MKKQGTQVSKLDHKFWCNAIGLHRLKKKINKPDSGQRGNQIQREMLVEGAF